MKKILFLFLVGAACAPFSANAQNQYSLVFLNKKIDAEHLPKEQVDKLMEGHMNNMKLLAKEGKLLAAGPFEGGGGIFVMNTKSVNEAKSWISNDPGVQANRWNVEVIPFTPRHGKICIAPEPYEMVNYSFIRFDAVVSKFTASTFPEIIRKHNTYLNELERTGNVIMEGIFGENDGGVLVMKGDIKPEVFESDPGVQEGLIDLTIKKLFIAKGSFCE
jgi:uncharacterized protein YciI